MDGRLRGNTSEYRADRNRTIHRGATQTDSTCKTTDFFWGHQRTTSLHQLTPDGCNTVTSQSDSHPPLIPSQDSVLTSTSHRKYTRTENSTFSPGIRSISPHGSLYLRDLLPLPTSSTRSADPPETTPVTSVGLLSPYCLSTPHCNCDDHQDLGPPATCRLRPCHCLIHTRSLNLGFVLG